MHILKRGALAAPLALVAALAMAMPAQGAGNTKEASCVITGEADATVLVTGGTGVYVFTALSMDCVVVLKKGASKMPETATVAAAFTSTGHFRNDVCGTGTAGDANPAVTSATGTNPTANSVIANGDYGYHVQFVGGVGTLYFTGVGSDTAASQATAPPTTNPSLTQPVGGGEVHILPTTIPPGSPVCTEGWTVEAAITGVFTDQ